MRIVADCPSYCCYCLFGIGVVVVVVVYDMTAVGLLVDVVDAPVVYLPLVYELICSRPESVVF